MTSILQLRHEKLLFQGKNTGCLVFTLFRIMLFNWDKLIHKFLQLKTFVKVFFY